MNQSGEIDEPYQGQKFTSFEALKKYLVEYGQKNFVKFWIRSSHTRNSLKGQKVPSIAKNMNPDLKYVSVKFACIFGGEKIRCRGSGIRKSSTFRNLGCPCMIKAVIGDDGNHVILNSVILQHNHPLCKTLYDSLKKTKKKGKINDQMNEDVVASSNLTYVQEGIVDAQIENVRENERTVLYKNSVEKESAENCLENIKDKFGQNVKILVVSSDSGKNNEIKDESEDEAELEFFEEDETNNLENLPLKICRLCLSAKEKLSPIFNPNLPLKSTVLSFKIMGCASIEISSDDGLPNHICKTCEANLDVAYKFRLRCENSDSLLRKAYSKKNKLLNSQIINLNKEDSPSEQLPIEENLITFQEPDIEKPQPLPEVDTNQEFLYFQFTVTCPVCESNFESYELMLEHLQTHTENESLLLTCNICNEINPTMKDLQNHMIRHLVEMKSDVVKCEQCNVILGSQEELKVHEESHKQSKKEDVKYLCNVCGKILKTKDRLESHKNSHEGLRPHVCFKCGRGFTDRKNLYEHYDIVHLRRVKHECPVCQKKFYTRTKMKSHLTMHYGVKPFACDLCDKTFRLKMNMVKHKKTHSSERPYKCDKCTAGFLDKNMLKRHSYIHGGIRPFPCNVCGHRFAVKCLLKKHLEKSKCALVIASGNDEKEDNKNSEVVGGLENNENYQWVDIQQPSLPEGECLVVAINDENVLQGENKTISMNILPEYNEECNS